MHMLIDPQIQKKLPETQTKTTEPQIDKTTRQDLILKSIKLPPSEVKSQDVGSQQDTTTESDRSEREMANYSDTRGSSTAIQNSAQEAQPFAKRLMSNIALRCRNISSSIKQGATNLWHSVAHSTPIALITDVARDIGSGIAETAKYVYSAVSKSFTKAQDIAVDYIISPIMKAGRAVMDNIIKPVYEFTQSAYKTAQDWVASKIEPKSNSITQKIAQSNARLEQWETQQRIEKLTSAEYISKQGTKPVNINSVPTASFQETTSLYALNQKTPEQIAQAEETGKRTHDDKVNKYLRDKDFADAALDR